MKLFSRIYGQGHPVIIIHGLYGASDNWVTIGKALSENFEVHMIDQRNHGRSPHSETHDYESMQNDLTEYMDDKRLERATIIGHSMGGKTAMVFAKNNTERISNLIIIDIAPKDYKNLTDHSQQTIDHLNIINALSAIDFNEIKSRQDADNWLAQFIVSKNVRQFLLKNLHRNKDNTFSWSLNVDALKNNISNILAGFEKSEIDGGLNITGFPVLFIKGDLSDYILENDFGMIRKIFPYAEISTIENAGHWLHAEKPMELIKLVENFILD